MADDMRQRYERLLAAYNRASAEENRLRKAMVIIRNRLHACNKPDQTSALNKLRIELRDYAAGILKGAEP